MTVTAQASELVHIAPPMRLGRMLRQSFHTMSPQERHRVVGMYAIILLLHLVGFGVFLAVVVPSHYKGLGFGVAITAYTLGLRHAFDADHTPAIHNATRIGLHDRRVTVKPRPFGFGFFFS